MFGKRLVEDMIDRSSENGADRRRFLQSAGLAGLGVAGVAALPGMTATASAATVRSAGQVAAKGPSDAAVLNFALNLEYLEAEFYSHAVFGHGLADKLTTGSGDRGKVTGGRKVKFSSKRVERYANEIAWDEVNHVEFIRKALGNAKVSRPSINLRTSFTAAARAAGLIGPKQVFDPYANENNFLLGAFLFEDVGVTAYKGAAPLIDNKTYLEAAAGILAVEAYHAATVRTTLFDKGLSAQAKAISDARDSLDGRADLDRGILLKGKANIAPADKNGIAYSRTPGQVLNIVYLNPKSVKKGGFFPAGVNGEVNTSA